MDNPAPALHVSGDVAGTLIAAVQTGSLGDDKLPRPRKKPMKTSRDVVWQRIGDHRLLFRLHSHTIELLALIPRRDLERKIKSLTSAIALPARFHC